MLTPAPAIKIPAQVKTPRDFFTALALNFMVLLLYYGTKKINTEVEQKSCFTQRVPVGLEQKKLPARSDRQPREGSS
jgi:hypothetical protein